MGRGLDPAARAVTVWRHLMSVMQGVRRGVDRVERARIFLDTREHSRHLLELVRKAPKGIEFGELQRQLHMQKSNVSRLAREMEFCLQWSTLQIQQPNQCLPDPVEFVLGQG